MPARQPRPGPVAGVLQPDVLLEPDDRRSTRSRCARSTATSTIDPTPARYTWTVGAAGELRPGQHHADADRRRLGRRGQPDRELPVRAPSSRSRSGATGDPDAQPPEPVVGQNARTLVRFPVPDRRADCELESATLRLYADGTTEDRTLEARAAGRAVPREHADLDEPARHAARDPGARPTSGEGYREWDVKAHVEAMIEAGVSHGWQIRDAHESDPERRRPELRQPRDAAGPARDHAARARAALRGRHGAAARRRRRCRPARSRRRCTAARC